MKDKLQVLKMVTGEDVLAKVTIEQDGTCTLNQPIQIVLVQQGDMISPVPRPYALFAKDQSKIKVQLDNIIFMTEPVDELVHMYQTVTGSIVVAPANALPPAGSKLELVKG